VANLHRLEIGGRFAMTDGNRRQLPKFKRGTNYAWPTIIQIAKEKSDTYDCDDRYGRTARSDSAQADSLSAKHNVHT
jgi:hypothetical protein